MAQIMRGGQGRYAGLAGLRADAAHPDFQLLGLLRGRALGGDRGVVSIVDQAATRHQANQALLEAEDFSEVLFIVLHGTDSYRRDSEIGLGLWTEKYGLKKRVG